MPSFFFLQKEKKKINYCHLVHKRCCHVCSVDETNREDGKIRGWESEELKRKLWSQKRIKEHWNNKIYLTSHLLSFLTFFQMID